MPALGLKVLKHVGMLEKNNIMLSYNPYPDGPSKTRLEFLLSGT